MKDKAKVTRIKVDKNDSEVLVLKNEKWVKAEPIKYEPTCWLEKHFPRLFEWLFLR